MPYLIDGHNLIPKVPGLSLQTADDEIALVERLQRYGQRAGKKMEVYFDNAPPGYSGRRKYGSVSAIFVRAGETADDRIRRRLSGLGREAKNWSVVSSDREVQAAARAAGAQVIPSEEFAAWLAHPTPSTKTARDAEELLSPDEIAAWLKEFTDGPPPDSGEK